MILVIEPFYTGSHKRLADLIHRHFSQTGQVKEDGSELLTLPGAKWHWRARTSALVLAAQVNRILEKLNRKDTAGRRSTCPSRGSQSQDKSQDKTTAQISLLFVSATLNLTELIGLCPRLSEARIVKVVYFHENQLIYPVRVQKQRDYQYGYAQILSCLSADQVWFNSEFNRTSFLEHMGPFLNIMPPPRPEGVVERIRPKCRVVYFPVEIPAMISGSHGTDYGGNPKSISETSENSGFGSEKVKLRFPEKSGDLKILWNHRWEHDKDPESFFDAMIPVHESGAQFDLYVLGEHGVDFPEIFNTAQSKLVSHIRQWGYVEDYEEYLSILRKMDLVVSTAKHEFFGVAVMEAVQSGALPLCPNRLVYPELYPKECLFNTQNQLVKVLTRFCEHPHQCRHARAKIEFDFSKFSNENFLDNFRQLTEL